MEDRDMFRLEAFSDAVFAIAITLLVLEIKVPSLSPAASNAELWEALGDLWPSFIAYVASFLAILITWVNHHELVHLVHHSGRVFMFANGALLLFVVFLPFPTAVLAHYLNQSAANVAAALYCGTWMLLNVCFNVVLHAALKSEAILIYQHDHPVIKNIRRAYLLALPVYFIATLLALLNAMTGLLVCFGVWILWAVLRYRA